MRERKPIDPALREFLDGRVTLDVAGRSPEPWTDPERAMATRAQLVAAVHSRAQIAGLPNDVVAHDVARAASLAGRRYLPASPTLPVALLVYLHGGGWVAGCVVTHDPFCRLLAHAASVGVLLVDYRLAPEHRHPAALDDACAAADWAARHAQAWGADPDRLVIAGDSAGANLAAVVTNRLAAAGGAAGICAQVLLYPVTDHPSGAHPSYEETGYGFGAEFMRWAWRQYAPAASPDDPDVSPLRRAPVPRLPPTFVATAEYDILRDEGVAYAGKLAAAGVAVTHHHSEDMHHNFCVNPATVGRFPQCQETLAILAGWIRRTVARAPA